MTRRLFDSDFYMTVVFCSCGYVIEAVMWIAQNVVTDTSLHVVPQVVELMVVWANSVFILEELYLEIICHSLIILYGMGYWIFLLTLMYMHSLTRLQWVNNIVYDIENNLISSDVSVNTYSALVSLGETQLASLILDALKGCISPASYRAFLSPDPSSSFNTVLKRQSTY